MFPSASTMVQTTQGHGGVVYCDCGMLSNRRVSRTERNPGREFYACPKIREDQTRCNYFKWADELSLQQSTIASPPSTPSLSASQGAYSSTPLASPEAQVLGREFRAEAMPSISRVPSTPSTRRSTTIEKVMQLPPTPVSASRHKVKPQTPEQRARRLALIQQTTGTGQPTPHGAVSHGALNNHTGHTFPQNGHRPLEGIDQALSEARVSAGKQLGSSPLKRTYNEVSDDKDQYWQDGSHSTSSRPAKVSKSNAQDIDIPQTTPVTTLFTSSSKGKGRAAPVQNTTKSQLPSDPENPFEVHGETIEAPSQATPALPATPSKERADAMEANLRDLQSFIAEYRKMAQKLKASELSIAAKEKAIARLTATVEAQKLQITSLEEKVEDLQNNVQYLENTVEGLYVERHDRDD